MKKKLPYLLTSIIFVEHQIDTVDTFLLLTQEMVMRELGLKLGSWLRIDRAQQVLRSEGPSTKPLRDSNCKREANQCHGKFTVSSDEIQNIIESDLACQSLLRGKLAEGLALKKNEKNLICRTVCSKIFKDAIKDERYVNI